MPHCPGVFSPVHPLLPRPAPHRTDTHIRPGPVLACMAPRHMRSRPFCGGLLALPSGPWQVTQHTHARVSGAGRPAFLPGTAAMAVLVWLFPLLTFLPDAPCFIGFVSLHLAGNAFFTS